MPLAECSVNRVEKESSPAGARIAGNLGTGRLGPGQGRWAQSPDVKEGPVHCAVPRSAALSPDPPGPLSSSGRTRGREVRPSVSVQVLVTPAPGGSSRATCFVCAMSPSPRCRWIGRAALALPLYRCGNRGALSSSRCCAQRVGGEGCAGARICRPRALGPSFQALCSARAPGSFTRVPGSRPP